MKSHILILLALVISCVEPDVSYLSAIESCLESPAVELVDSIEYYLYPKDCLVGARLPIFTATTIENKEISDDYFLGKVSFINFWFQNCPPCVAEIPILNKLKSKYGTSQVNYLAIGTDSEKDIIEFLQDHPFTFDHIADGRAIVKEVFKNPWGYPTSILTDREGKIVKVIRGGPADSTSAAAIFQKYDKLLASLTR